MECVYLFTKSYGELLQIIDQLKKTALISVEQGHVHVCYLLVVYCSQLCERIWLLIEFDLSALIEIGENKL